MGEHSKINPGPFIEFLNNVCPPLLGSTRDDFSRLFAKLEMMNKVRHFVGDDQDTSLFISREVREKDEGSAIKREDGKGGLEEREYNIVAEPEVSFKGKNANTIAFLKRNPATFRAAYEGTLPEKTDAPDPLRVAAQAAFGSQNAWVPHLQLISMGSMDSECSPFELVNCFLQNAFVPLFNAYTKSEGTDDHGDETKVGIPNVQRKIADLSMALMQCQQNVEIEDICLPIDPDILEAFEKAKQEGRQHSADDFQDRMNDSTFLNQLQSGVNK